MGMYADYMTPQQQERRKELDENLKYYQGLLYREKPTVFPAPERYGGENE